MSDNDTTTPSADSPEDVAQKMHNLASDGDLDGLHANGDVDFKRSGNVGYSVTVWVHADANAAVVGKAYEMLEGAGYDVWLKHKSSGDVVIKASASN